MATLSRAPALSAGVLTADLTRLGAELEHLRGKDAWLAKAAGATVDADSYTDLPD